MNIFTYGTGRGSPAMVSATQVGERLVAEPMCRYRALSDQHQLGAPIDY